jgi:hypothetical protein
MKTTMTELRDCFLGFYDFGDPENKMKIKFVTVYKTSVAESMENLLNVTNKMWEKFEAPIQ